LRDEACSTAYNVECKKMRSQIFLHVGGASAMDVWADFPTGVSLEDVLCERRRRNTHTRRWSQNVRQHVTSDQ